MIDMKESTNVCCKEETTNVCCKEETIDVYVNCEYNSWYCRPATLYKIPSEIFNYNMMIGALEDENDLQNLVDKIDQNIVYDEYIDVYIGADKNWSGVDSFLFQIPLDVFEYLNYNSKQSTDKTIGRLENQADLNILIEKTRNEMINGIIETPEIVFSKPKNGEMKDCGHMCTISCLKTGCCSCLDVREVREEGTYPNYVDGKGYQDVAMRNEFYCPFCK